MNKTPLAFVLCVIFVSVPSAARADFDEECSLPAARNWPGKKSSECPKIVKGPKGAKGDKGDKGDPGDVGLPGPRGFRGVSGRDSDGLNPAVGYMSTLLKASNSRHAWVAAPSLKVYSKLDASHEFVLEGAWALKGPGAIILRGEVDYEFKRWLWISTGVIYQNINEEYSNDYWEFLGFTPGVVLCAVRDRLRLRLEISAFIGGVQENNSWGFATGVVNSLGVSSVF